jgi:indolepyruvate ferredoxin oxidoreductase beta subunit
VYPEGIIGEIMTQFPGSLALDALTLARESGSEKTANVVVLGAASGMLPYNADEWRAALAACIRPQHLDMNLRAFEAGRSA